MRDNTAAFPTEVNLASAALGARALLCSDDVFASMHNLVKPEPPGCAPESSTEGGTSMDGWASRRQRIPGNDWCILQLGVAGVLRGVDIDTRHVTGDHPPFASLDATLASPDASPEELRDHATWTEILPAMPIQPDRSNLSAIHDDRTWTHVRLRIHPDGGIARLRVFGEPVAPSATETVDLACITSGGRALTSSEPFSSSMNHLLLPEAATHTGQGWETRRSRPLGENWLILKLGTPGAVSEVVLDTQHVEGNVPERAVVDALYWPDAPTPALIDHPDWSPILPDTFLKADHAHVIAVPEPRPVTHLRLRLWPGGGVSRLRAHGRSTARTPADDDPLLTWLNGASEAEAYAALSRCCGASRWARDMVAARPFTSRTHLHGHARVAWWRRGPADWREAFTHHPRIGADPAALRARFATTASWSSNEQAGMKSASEDTIQALAAGNQAYEDRFGFLFIVCASGLSADEMLARLQRRLPHDPDAELRIAAGEQAKITALRLEKLTPPTPEPSKDAP